MAGRFQAGFDGIIFLAQVLGRHRITCILATFLQMDYIRQVTSLLARSSMYWVMIEEGEAFL